MSDQSISTIAAWLSGVAVGMINGFVFSQEFLNIYSVGAISLLLIFVSYAVEKSDGSKPTGGSQ